MDQVVQSHVAMVATQVRYWTEGRAPQERQLLNGWCAIASARLFNELKKLGIKSEIHAWVSDGCGSAHVYVVVDDHIVDVTATQFRPFRHEPVVIMHQREAEQHTFYQTVSVFHSVDDLRKWQKKGRWPADQMAYGEPRK
jgi:hypothetical protein